MEGVVNGVVGVLMLVLLLIVVCALLGGLIVLGVTHVFHLQDLVHMSYWQCCGIGLLLGGVGASGQI